MRTIRIALFSALALSAFVLGSPAAGAVNVADCQAAIAQLQADTNAGQFTNSKDQTMLAGKAQAAADKLDVNKPNDALRKLEDYSAKLDALAAATKPKVSAESYATLHNDVTAAMSCVEALLAAT